MAERLKRGQIVAVIAPRDFGKARPAVLVQTDLLNSFHPTLLVCLVTSDQVEASRFRIPLAATAQSGLQVASQAMVDKIFAIPREKVGSLIGQVTEDEISAINNALGYTLGLIR